MGAGSSSSSGFSSSSGGFSSSSSGFSSGSSSSSSSGGVWAVQGIINWTDLCDKMGEGVSVYPVYKPDWRWDLPNGNKLLEWYRVYDDDIFLPKAEQVFKPVPLGIMAGGLLLKKQPGADPDVSIDWYQIWAWADTNNNGVVDEGDLVDGEEQEWKQLLQETNVPGVNTAVDLLQSSMELQAGITYFLLLRVGASGKTNLQFSSNIKDVVWPALEIADEWAEYAEEGWSATDDRRYPANWSPAVEGREIVRVRVNSPSRGPVY